jgi:hypothetical protein
MSEMDLTMGEIMLLLVLIIVFLIVLYMAIRLIISYSKKYKRRR